MAPSSPNQQQSRQPPPIRGQQDSSIAKKSEPWLTSMKRSLGRTKPRCQCKHHQRKMQQKLAQQQEEISAVEEDKETIQQIVGAKKGQTTQISTHQQIKALKKLYGNECHAVPLEDIRMISLSFSTS